MRSTFSTDYLVLHRRLDSHLHFACGTALGAPHRNILQAFLPEKRLFPSGPDKLTGTVAALQRPVAITGPVNHLPCPLLKVQPPQCRPRHACTSDVPRSRDERGSYVFRPLFPDGLKISSTVPQFVYRRKQDLPNKAVAGALFRLGGTLTKHAPWNPSENEDEN
jgi:hypothetical protein